MTLRGIIPLAKKIVRLRGPDTLPLLQGLLTNDVQSQTKVVYSYLLNSQGRVLFDLFVYKLDTNDVLLETDTGLETSLLKVLHLYKLRRSVSMESSTYTACVSFDESNTGVIKGPDPRLPELGYKTIQEAVPISESGSEEYRELRYRLGVPEGSEELGVGKAIPLESNGDYLNAISFNKGCYIGQELTARAHHTGVIRKRYMPLVLSGTPGKAFKVEEQPVLNEKGAKVGVLKAALATRGLGLMRIRESLEAENLSVQLDSEKFSVQVSCPQWWPKLTSS